MGVLSYVKTLWQDRAVATPNLYTKTGETGAEVTLVPKPTTVTQAGTAINAARLNNMENGIAAALPAGSVNADIGFYSALLQDIDTRNMTLNYTNGDLTQVLEKDGSTTIKTTNLGYTNGNLTTVTEIVGGKTITTTLAYTNGILTGVSNTVV